MDRASFSSGFRSLSQGNIGVPLLLLVVLFGMALDWLGFVVSSTLFLMGGYWLLGERRIKTLLLASIPFVLVFWFVLVKLLDIYLAPGRLFS